MCWPISCIQGFRQVIWPNFPRRHDVPWRSQRPAEPVAQPFVRIIGSIGVQTFMGGSKPNSERQRCLGGESDSLDPATSVYWLTPKKWGFRMWIKISMMDLGGYQEVDQPAMWYPCDRSQHRGLECQFHLGKFHQEDSGFQEFTSAIHQCCLHALEGETNIDPPKMVSQ